MLDRTEMRKILMQSIVECSNPDFTEESISRGIDAGLEKIETTQIKRDGQKTFEVQVVPGGYGFWSRGGFDGLKNCGIFLLPTSPEGGPLPEMARMNEKNGRHAFHGIYQGCYILQAVCPQPPVIHVNIFKIMRIDREAELAYCTHSHLWELSHEEYESLRAAMEVARDGSVRVNNADNHYFWRVK